MEMFVLSYLMYCAFTPDSVFKSVLPNGSELTWQTIMLYSDIVPVLLLSRFSRVWLCATP